MDPATTLAQSTSLPPMLRQYLECKVAHPDCLILFQVGDFYEVFFDDARTVARTLNLTLTSRDKSSENPIPMCGVPLGVVDGYVERLVSAGFSVAIVSQNGPVPAKGMVPRSLERIVTPGVQLLGLEGSSQAALPSVGALLIESELHGTLAWSTVQDGQVWLRETVSLRDIAQEIARSECQELVCVSLVTEKTFDRRSKVLRKIEATLAGPVKWRGVSYTEGMTEFLPSGYGQLSPFGKKAAQLLLNYLAETTVEVGAVISQVEKKFYDDIMSIDEVTRRNLELVSNQRDGSAQGSLYGFLDRTVTRAGSGLLRRWVLQPLRAIEPILRRHQAVGSLRSAASARTTITELLRNAPSLERIAARVSLAVAHPRELGGLRDFMEQLPILQQIVLERAEDASTSNPQFPSLLRDLGHRMQPVDELVVLLSATLADEPPALLHEGGVIREGVHDELDRLRSLACEGSSWIRDFEQGERTRTGIPTLKVKCNNVIGYFIEVTKAQLHKVPSDYERRQSTTNADRFVIHSLKIKEQEVLGAKDREIALERELYSSFRDAVKKFVPHLREVAAAIAELDVLVALSEVAEREGLVMPVLTETEALHIEGGRHPVLAARIGGEFIANSLSLCAANDHRVALITGPNMGGKSTFLRQNALIVIMAQLGSFVPATGATIGLVDRIFARIGASDDIHEGESTFMIEMREAATIIGHATNRSLVLIDEIGRGTSTTDGLALAQAILEWLLDNVRCKTLFATHFHQLISLDATHPTLQNLSVGVKEEVDGLVFTHAIGAGSAARSYGLEVARLAGFPAPLLDRAKTILLTFESSDLPPFDKTMRLIENVDDKMNNGKDERVDEKAGQPLETVRQLPLLALVPTSSASKVRTGREGNLATYSRGDLGIRQALQDLLLTVEVANTTPAKAVELLEEVKRLITAF